MTGLNLPDGWREVLRDELTQPYPEQLAAFVAAERAAHTVYPPAGEEFTALELTPPERVRVVILGQDPYHGPGQAHGLAFSVRLGVPPPPSLVNIFKELRSDLGLEPPGHGQLVAWARQSVLLLNAVLTVRAGAANSHKGHGWERLTDAIIRAVSAGPQPVVFLLWGAPRRRRPSWWTRRATRSCALPTPRRSPHATASLAAGPSRGPTPPSRSTASRRSTGV